ncbi:unnamed protein product [Protopolystoma xenopodis]|uniref:Uncharacterized protein n=1 Tax=Protopolystoma xenopodis TaxID=117903 RepID=A0A3S5AG75_9PLAT|nr:unnamed protein product [Protopolystoma xenopodis]
MEKPSSINSRLQSSQGAHSSQLGRTEEDGPSGDRKRLLLALSPQSGFALSEKKLFGSPISSFSSKPPVSPPTLSSTHQTVILVSLTASLAGFCCSLLLLLLVRSICQRRDQHLRNLLTGNQAATFGPNKADGNRGRLGACESRGSLEACADGLDTASTCGCMRVSGLESAGFEDYNCPAAELSGFLCSVAPATDTASTCPPTSADVATAKESSSSGEAGASDMDTDDNTTKNSDKAAGQTHYDTTFRETEQGLDDYRSRRHLLELDSTCTSFHSFTFLYRLVKKF